MTSNAEQEVLLTQRVFGDYEAHIEDARSRVAATIVSTQLGFTRKAERLAAQSAITHYAEILCNACNEHLSGLYKNLHGHSETDDSALITNEYLINRGVDEATDAVEAEVRKLHTTITEERADRSKPHVVFEYGRASRFAPFLGRIIVNGPGAAAAWGGNEILVGQVDNKFLVGSILVAVFAGVRFGAPIVLKSAAQAVLGKRVEKVLQPVSPEIRARLKHADSIRKKHGLPAVSLHERVKKIRGLETDKKVDALHDEFGSDVRDWLLASSSSNAPTREQAVAIIRQGVSEHLFDTYGFSHHHENITEAEAQELLQ